MRTILLGAMLLAGSALLVGASSAHAQTGAPLPTSGRGGTLADCRGSYCSPDLCDRPSQSYGARTGYTRFTSAQGSAIFAPGGEAYSYAGYGSSYSPYLDDGGPTTWYGDGGAGGDASLLRVCTQPTGDTPNRGADRG